jgi:hypothetical protein
VNLNGDFLFDLSGAGIGMGDSWTIVNVGSLTETFGATFTVKNFTDNLDNTWTYTTGPGQYYTFTEATGVLNYVPEPATMGIRGEFGGHNTWGIRGTQYLIPGTGISGDRHFRPPGQFRGNSGDTILNSEGGLEK